MEILRSSIDVISEEEEEKIISEEEEEEEEEHFHVLAVDDSLLDRKLLEKLLKVSSYKVTCVDSGDEALKYLGLVDDDVDKNSASCTSSSSSSSSSNSPQEGTKVNLIMTDYCMPGMTGYDLLKRVKGSSWKNVPVVIMSSENVPSRISKCLEGGAEEFLLKPVQLSDLKNLENYPLKPLIDHSCESKINENDDTIIISDDEDLTANYDNDDDEDLAANYDNDDDIIGVVNSNNNNNNNGTNNNMLISKRKAVMSPSPSQRRPNKVKGLAVII